MDELALIGIDLDDLLAKDAAFFVATEALYFGLLGAAGAGPGQVAAARADFYKTEEKNIPFCGYGVGKLYKTFIDIALKHAPEHINAALVSGITMLAEDLRHYPLEAFEDTKAFLERLNRFDARKILITKGEYFHQTDKVARLKAFMGDAWPFEQEFIRATKNERDYHDILKLCGVESGRFLMVGDSIRSDANPVLAIGGHAIVVERRDLEGLKRMFEKADVHAGGLERLQILPDLVQAGDAIENLLKPGSASLHRPAPQTGPAL